MSRTIVFTQQVVPHYRVRMFDLVAEHLAESGIDFQVTYSDDCGLTVKNAPEVPARNWALLTRAFRTTILGVRFIYRRIEVDGNRKYILVTELEAANLNSWIALFTGRAYVLFGHGKSYVSTESKLSRLAEKILCRHAEHILTYTPSGRAAVLERTSVHPSRVTTFYNSTDTTEIINRVAKLDGDEITAFKRRLGILESSRVAVFVGALEPYKKIDLLLDSAQIAMQRDENLHLIVAGEGSEADKVADFRRRNLGRVTYLKHAGPSEWALFGCVAEVLLVPGRVGLVAADSIAAGLPVLTTDYELHAPEIEYLLESRSCVSVSVDKDEFAAAWTSTDWSNSRPTGRVPSAERSAEVISKVLNAQIV